MNPIATIVVGVEFSEGSRIALAEALRIARATGAQVHPVHVIDALVASELEEAVGAHQANVRESLVADAKAAWAEFAKGLDGATAQPLEVRIDHRVRGIVAAAEALHADVLVLGARGDRRPEVGPGTIATACVRHAASDVLLVRDTQAGPHRVVVACVDFSPASGRALLAAARVAARDGAALHVLHVFDAPWHQLHYRSPTPEADPHFQAQYREALARRLAAFADEAGPEVAARTPIYRLFDHSGHRSGIVEYAKVVHADLIVLGTRGRTTLRDLVLGTTAEKALKESTCSVLAVRPAPEASAPAEAPPAPPIVARPRI